MTKLATKEELAGKADVNRTHQSLYTTYSVLENFI